MNFHSYSCYANQMFDGTEPCTCWKEIKAGDMVRYYPDLRDSEKYSDLGVVEVYGDEIKALLLTNREKVLATHCVLIFLDRAA